jgi:hypothetical protein
MRRWAVSLVVVLVFCALFAVLIAPARPNAGFKDAASVLALISLSAVAIERGIEAFFSAMSGRLGEWWPLRAVRAEFDTFETSTNAVLGDVARMTLDELAAARDLADQTADKVAALQGLIDGIEGERARLHQQLDDVTRKLPPGSARLARLGEIGSSMATTLHDAHGRSMEYTTEGGKALRAASDAAERASLIIASFTDNPARRVASLILGASLGMVLAGALGLNLFVATLAAPDGTTDIVGLLAGKLGFLVTGVVIGLGSSPTHEVVKSLQAYKDARSGAVQVPTLTTGAATSPQVIDEAAGPRGFGASADGGSVAIYRVRGVRRSS